MSNFMVNHTDKIIWKTTVGALGIDPFEIYLVEPPVAKIYLITYTGDPIQMIAKVTSTYKGHLEPDDVDEYTIHQVLDDMKRTKLQTPMEMLHFVWLLKDVTRAFTHQLVRYRIGTSFAQESMRFYGSKDIYKVLATGTCRDPQELQYYSEAVTCCIKNYEILLHMGVESENARGILPTNILTSIFFDCSMRTLQNIFSQRVCCQAQKGEWLNILLSMRKIIQYELGPHIAEMLKASVELGIPCGYDASFDRPCVWKNGIPGEAK